MAGWSGVGASGATAGALVFFGVGFGLALAGAAAACPEFGCFFASVTLLLALELVGAVPVPAANGLAEPAPPPGFCSIPVLIGLLLFAGVGEVVAAGTPVCVPPGVFGAFGSTFGTLGSLFDRMSAARMGAGPEAAERELSVISVITSTSSNRLRSAAGLILITRKGSFSRSSVAPITVPTAYPLG